MKPYFVDLIFLIFTQKKGLKMAKEEEEIRAKMKGWDITWKYEQQVDNWITRSDCMKDMWIPLGKNIMFW